MGEQGIFVVPAPAAETSVAQCMSCGNLSLVREMPLAIFSMRGELERL